MHRNITFVLFALGLTLLGCGTFVFHLSPDTTLIGVSFPAIIAAFLLSSSDRLARVGTSAGAGLFVVTAFLWSFQNLLSNQLALEIGIAALVVVTAAFIPFRDRIVQFYAALLKRR